MSLHQELVELREKVIHGQHNPIFGICTNLRAYVPTDLFRKWPKFSGNNAFPVPAPRWSFFRGDARSKYTRTNDKWVGRYGKLRRELLDWLIEETAKDAK